MLEAIIQYLQTRLVALFPDIEVKGIFEKITEESNGKKTTFPAGYCSNGEYTDKADFDNFKALTYFRKNGNMRSAPFDDDWACEIMQQRTYPMRLVAWIPKDYYKTDNEYIKDKLYENLNQAISLKESSAILSATKLTGIQIIPSEFIDDPYKVWEDEYSNVPFNVPFDRAYIAINFDVIATGSLSCFEAWECGDTQAGIKFCADAEVTDADGLLLANVESRSSYAVPDSEISDIEGNLIISLPATQDYTAKVITPAFTQSATSINAGNAITFTDQTTATHDEYLWDFGDGTYSTSQNPSKTYLVGGLYSVTLTVSNSANGAAGVLTKSDLITVANVFLLDLFPGAEAAYAFFRLRAAYAGSVNRVYNGSSEQDIGFSSNEYDEAAFNTFVGAGTGHASKWYDQSGNVRDLIQAGTTAMPLISLNQMNNTPANVFDGTTDYMDAAGVTTPNGKTIYLVMRFNVLGSGEQLLFDSTVTTQHGFNKSQNSSQNFISVAFGNSVQSTTAFTLNKALISIVHDGASSQIYRNNSLVITANFGTNAFNGLRLGALRGVSASLFYNGIICAFIVFPTVHNTATRQAIESVINAHLNVY